MKWKSHDTLNASLQTSYRTLSLSTDKLAERQATVVSRGSVATRQTYDGITTLLRVYGSAPN